MPIFVHWSLYLRETQTQPEVDGERRLRFFEAKDRSFIEPSEGHSFALSRLAKAFRARWNQRIKLTKERTIWLGSFQPSPRKQFNKETTNKRRLLRSGSRKVDIEIGIIVTKYWHTTFGAKQSIRHNIHSPPNRQSLLLVRIDSH